MFLKLRIIFTVIAAILAAAVLPVGAWLDLIWAISCAVGAGVFFVLMLLCKQEQEKREPPKEQSVDDEKKESDNEKKES